MSYHDNRSSTASPAPSSSSSSEEFDTWTTKSSLSSASSTSLTLKHSKQKLIPRVLTSENALLESFNACSPLQGELIAVLVKSSHTAENVDKLFVIEALDTAAKAGVWTSADNWSIDQASHLVAETSKTEGSSLSSLIKLSFDDSEGLSHAETLNILSRASLRTILSIPSTSTSTTLHILERPEVAFPPLSGSLILPSYTSHLPSQPHHPLTPASAATWQDPIDSNPFGIPTPLEWSQLWAAWDLVTLSMICPSMLLQKPIDLRHKCLFYIGHIPTFVDMLLSKSIGGAPSEPAYFWNIFERGIDPHVDDPTGECHHSHSDVPKEDADWPTLETVLAFRDRVRTRLMRVYDDLLTGKRTITRNLARTLVMTFEHEGFHVETLLYMLIQRAGCGTFPPPGFTAPPWEFLASQWSEESRPDTPHAVLGPADLVMGHDDSEADDASALEGEGVESHIFGWDNESPQRVVQVGKFEAEWRPISNEEYFQFWTANGREEKRMPKSWVAGEGEEIQVRTLYGPVALSIAARWPVLASYDDLALYAQSKGGRLPTEPELRLFLDTYDVGYEGGANVGFRHWHPVPATMGLAKDGGRGGNGGVWEWTSTAFDTHDGIAPTNIFTGYSTDFFDGKHQVVLGASYVTIPRLAGRRTVRNFYQHNYPYPWVAARVVYDSVN